MVVYSLLGMNFLSFISSPSEAQRTRLHVRVIYPCRRSDLNDVLSLRLAACTAWMPAEFCSESLQADVSTDLRAIWSTIGVPEDAQQAQIQELSGKIAALLRGAVQHEEGRQGQLKEEVERMTRELGELCATLAEPQPDLTADPPGLLVQQHAAAAAAVERSKVQRANRAAQRREMEAQCVSLHCELTDMPADKRSQVTASEIVPGPGPAEKDGLSTTFLGTLRAELERLQAERAARIDQAAFFSSDIGRLQKELGLKAALLEMERIFLYAHGRPNPFFRLEPSSSVHLTSRR